MSLNERNIEYEVTIKEEPVVKVEIDIVEIQVILAAIDPVNIEIQLAPREIPILVDVDNLTSLDDTLPNKFGIITAPFRFIKSVIGKKTTFGKTALSITNHISTGPTSRIPKYGTVAVPIIFGKAVVARKKTFGVVARPIGFNRSVAGINVGPSGYGSGLYGAGVYSGGNYAGIGSYARGTDGTGTYGGGSYGTLSVAASSVSLSITFSKSVSGRKTTFGQTALVITNNRVVSGSGSTPTSSNLYGRDPYGAGLYGR